MSAPWYDPAPGEKLAIQATTGGGGGGGAGSSFPDFTGSGSPEGVVTATVGKSYVDTTNGTLYFKGYGTTGTTGWVVAGGQVPGVHQVGWLADSGSLYAIAGSGLGVQLTDNAAREGTGNGITWNNTGGADGAQDVVIGLGPAETPHVTQFNADGTTNLPGNLHMTGSSSEILADSGSLHLGDGVLDSGAGNRLSFIGGTGDGAQHVEILLGGADPDYNFHTTRFNADGTTVLPGTVSVAGGPQTGPMLPIADPTGVTIETYANEINGGHGDIQVLTFPADAALLAVKIVGDAHPRFMVSVDPYDYGTFYFGDGTFNPVDGPLSIGVTNSNGVHLLGVGGTFVVNGDLLVPIPGNGVILTAPDSSKHRLKVAADGTLSTEPVT